MAQALLEGTKLRLVFQAGMDDEGNALYKSKTFSNVKKESTADQLYQAAQAITVLCNDTIEKIERNDSTELMA